MQHTEETKQKMREAKLKNPTRYWLGKKKTPEHIEKIKQTLISRGIEPKVKFVGYQQNHPNWKGGKPNCRECGKSLSSYSSIECRVCSYKTIAQSNTGRIITKEWRQKLSESHKGKNMGELHWNFKGYPNGERNKLMVRIEYKLWREAVFKRDNYTCQICNQYSGYLEADHIKPWAVYPELRYAIDNGQTLCKNCHKLKTKIDWQDYHFKVIRGVN